MLDYFGQGEVGRFGIEIAFHDLKIRCSRSQEVIGFLVREVSETKDLADFARRE